MLLRYRLDQALQSQQDSEDDGHVVLSRLLKDLINFTNLPEILN